MSGDGEWHTDVVVSKYTQTTADERTVGRFWTHVEGRHAQGPDLTSLYPANTGYSEVMGQR